MLKSNRMEQRQIKEIRGRLGLSQERFGQLLGVSLQTVWRWESGLTKPLPIVESKLEELRTETMISRRRLSGIPKTGGIPKRAAPPVEGGLGGLFKGFGSVLDLVSGIAGEVPQEGSRTGKAAASRGRLKGVWGFSITTDLGGSPVIERFGNIQDTETGTVVTSIREPLVDVMEEGDHLAIIVELPGLEERDIHIRLAGDILEINGQGQHRVYRKEILLPLPVDPETLESSYRNGILDIRLAPAR